MRLTASRLAFLIAGAVALTACGAQRAGTIPPAPRSTAPASFTARAQQVIGQWNASRAARVWRTGLVVLDPSDLTPIPSAGFANMRQKDAFTAGRFRLAGTLPTRALMGAVHWADGATLVVPVLSARATYDMLATNQPCGGPYPCGSLTVTGARLGTVTLLTSRGRATVPAWHFTITGLGWQASQVAVAPQARAVLPRMDVIPPDGQGVPGVAGVAAISPDNRTLTLLIATSACVGAWGARAYQSATAVAVGSWTTSSGYGGPCPLVAVSRRAHVRLAAPLGTRVVLDVATGRPLVPGAPPLP